MSDSNPNLLSPRDPFVNAIASFLRTHVLAGQSAPRDLLVAISGGPDSTALVWAIAALRTELPVKLLALHVNHGLRAEESDGDEDFCKQLCGRLQVELRVERLSGEVKDENGLRDARYFALVKTARELGAQVVVTGHTLDDQAETVLFRLFRGTGPSGLTGMEEFRPLTDGIFLARPMLTVRRQNVLEFLARFNLASRNDSSNKNTDYARNYLRHEVIPAIESKFPGASVRVDRLRTLLAEDEELLDSLVSDALRRVTVGAEEPVGADELEVWSLGAFQAEAKSIQRRLIGKALRDRCLERSFERTALILRTVEAQRGAVSLDAVWELQVDADTIQWVEKVSLTATERTDYEQPIQMPGLTVSQRFECTLQIEQLPAEFESPAFPPAQAHEALVSLEDVKGTHIVLRQRREGDRIRPFGMDELVKLKKYLHTHKPSAPIGTEPKGTDPMGRERILVLANEEEVLWVPGVGISDRLKALNKPTHRIRFVQLTPKP